METRPSAEKKSQKKTLVQHEHAYVLSHVKIENLCLLHHTKKQEQTLQVKRQGRKSLKSPPIAVMSNRGVLGFHYYGRHLLN